MRLNLAVLVIMITCIQVNAGIVHAQNVTVNVKDAPLRTVFETFRKQTGYQFFFDNDVVKKANKVTMKLKGAPLKEALDQLFNQQPLTYEIVEKTIVVTEKTGQPSSYFKQQVITGKVTNQSGQPLPGVTVSVKGTSRMTATDNQGNFTIDAGFRQVLVFAYVGYTSQEEAVGNREVVNVILMESISQLDMVKIQGYGTTTQRLATGNIATINAKTIGQQPVTNPLQALSARIAGLQIKENSGLPGAPISVQIRGRNSIDASNTPFYVVDGVPFFSETLASAQTLTQISPLNSINPNDIESITVLKDADATAIYGSRAANGVILITTKKGSSGKMKLGVTFDRGFSTVTRLAKPLSTEQYLQMRRDALANSNVVPSATTAPDLISWDQNLDNNSQDWLVGNSAQVWNGGATFSGGNEHTQFLISGNFHEESTIYSASDKYRRANAHATISHRSSDKKFSLNFSAIYASDNSKINSRGGFSSVAQLPPNYPLYDANGNFNWLGNFNNYQASALAYQKTNTDNLNANLTGSYKLLKGLEAKVSLGYGKILNESMRPAPSISKNPASISPLGSNAFGTVETKSFLFEPQLNYNLEIAKGKLSVLAASTLQKRTSNTNGIVVSNYFNDLLLETYSAGTVSAANSTNVEYNYLSFFGRVNYNWDDKYVFNVNFRRDGSSRFGPGKHFGNFGSIAGAWIFTNESFAKKAFKFLSYGKLRASYGTTGSDGIGDYGYLSLYSSLADYGTFKTLSPSQIANANFQWEVNKKLELALDLGLIKDKILLSSTWYRNRSGNQLVTYPLPTTTGFSGFTANLPALVQNDGWEFDLNTQNITEGEFSWTSALNLTIPRNKLLSFPNIELTSYANTLVIGQSLNSILSYHLIGIDPQTGLSVIQDVDNNNVISGNSSYNGRGGDRIYIGNTDPKWYGGFSNSFSYKGLKLDVLLQYTKQRGYNLYNTQNGFANFGTAVNVWNSYGDYWKQVGAESKLPKPFATTNTSAQQFAESDAAFSDASFFRLKNVSLSYELNPVWLKQFPLCNIQVYAQGQNLWTITDYNGYDPEGASNLGLTIPPLKTITIGLRGTF